MTEPGDVIAAALRRHHRPAQPERRRIRHGSSGAQAAKAVRPSLPKIADQILADLDHYKSDAPTHDDQTLVVLKVK